MEGGVRGKMEGGVRGKMEGGVRGKMEGGVRGKMEGGGGVGVGVVLGSGEYRRVVALADSTWLLLLLLLL